MRIILKISVVSVKLLDYLELLGGNTVVENAVRCLHQAFALVILAVVGDKSALECLDLGRGNEDVGRSRRSFRSLNVVSGGLNSLDTVYGVKFLAHYIVIIDRSCGKIDGVFCTVVFKVGAGRYPRGKDPL